MTQSGSVTEAERRVLVQLAVARIIIDAPTTVDVIPRILEEVCRGLGWAWGACWRLDPSHDVLSCAASWSDPSIDLRALETLSHESHFPRGIGIPGYTWERGQPVWVPDVLCYPNFPRVTAASQSHLHAAVAAPITIADETVGVIEFLGREIQQPDADLLAMLSTISGQMSRVIERDQMIATLREREARTTAILESALDSIVSIDRHGRIIDWNPAAERMFGYMHADVLGRIMAELIVPPDFRELHYHGFSRHLTAGTSTILGQRLELRAMRADGTVFPIELTVTRTDVLDQPRFTAHIRDITDREQAEAERMQLLERERTARILAEEARERIAHLQALTAAFSRALTPTEVAEVVITQGVAALGAVAGRVAVLSPDGRTLSLVGGVGYPPALLERWQHVAIERPVPITEAVRTATPVWLSSREELFSRFPDVANVPNSPSQALAAVPLVVGGRPIGALGLSFPAPRRLTQEERTFIEALAHHCAQALERARLYEAEQQARTAAEEAARVRQEFLSVASHELRTPLTSIKASAQLLARWMQPGASIDARLNKLVQQLLGQTQRLEALAADLLDASRIQRDRLELRFQSVDLVQLAQDVLLRFEHQPERTDRHRLVLDAPPTVSGEWDPDRLDQVLTNLISNALKYSPDGGEVRITIDHIGDTAEISVTDQGIGIPVDEQLDVFEPFTRGRQVKGQGAGVGLGLYIVRQIVEQHGGVIAVESTPGQGSRFRIRLPLAKP